MVRPNGTTLKNLLKYKDTKEFVLAIYIITTSSTEEIIRQNDCERGFLDNLLLKQDFDKKIMINVITS